MAESPEYTVPCPWCDSETTMRDSTPRHGPTVWQVWCYICDARGPGKVYRQAAADEWNRIVSAILRKNP